MVVWQRYNRTGAKPITTPHIITCLMAYNRVQFVQIGLPWHAPTAVALPLNPLVSSPMGTYGIAYDVFMHEIEDNVSNGWASWRCGYIYTMPFNTSDKIAAASVYQEIANTLTAGGFVCKQYSIWQCVTTATFTWNEMLQLRAIHSRGILATISKCLEMFHIPGPNIFIVTNDIHLGGVFSPTMIGPMLAGLAQDMYECGSTSTLA